jgi:hypothetical protein
MTITDVARSAFGIYALRDESRRWRSSSSGSLRCAGDLQQQH